MATRFKNRNIRSVASKIVLGAGVYYIWQERNKRQFTSEKRPAETLLETILESVKPRLMSIRVINSSQQMANTLVFKTHEFEF
ncbi:reverse transcriptase zinc-binding domain-containing protein [Artemisia annua]|uniref:Reverse transcriptase zinc-binding domain-containing protein n=1 Tax=Artemisia annua TaxID=35608 RepID=A0A2U1PUA1_ARTAN|nr:reverse transcriptase zinc-binding domain-containing protein [Artemisia annua]